MDLPRRSTALRGRRVGIAGAGLAGLSAAWALERRGASVTLFEASGRIGGRVLTVRDLPGASHAELGGEIIEEEGKEAITAIAGEHGLGLQRILRGGFHYYAGASRSGGTLTSGKQLFDRLRDLLRDEIGALARAEAQPGSNIARALGGRSALDWARASRRPREATRAVETLRGFFVAEPSEFSLLMLVEQLSQDGDPASMKMYRIAGGSARLPEALAASLRGRIEMSSSVRALDSSGLLDRTTRRMRAVIDTRGARSTFACDAFVVAVPATMARGIAFTPRLPAPQGAAIATLPYGLATKAAVSFDRRFWRRRGHAFATRLPVGAVWEAGAKGNRGTLAFLGGGETSASLASLAADGSERDWQKALRWLGIGGARVLDVAAITWEHDPYIRGAYAHQSPAFDPRLLASLAAPAGRIAFAGEHTSSSHQGYMEGAVASGLRAADDIELVLKHG